MFSAGEHDWPEHLIAQSKQSIHLNMKSLCSTSLFIGWLLLSSSVLFATEQPELEWCLDHYPNLHSYPATGDPHGPAVDFMRELAVKAGFILKFSPNTPFSRCLKQMEQGTADLMFGLNHSTQRESFMHLIPYATGLPAVIYINNHQVEFTDFSQLQKTTIAVVRGYVYNDKLLQRIKQQKLSRHEADSLDNALALLLLNRVQAVIASQQQAVLLIASKSQFQGKFRVLALDAELTNVLYDHLGFSKKSQHAMMLATIQKAVQQLIEEGKVQLLLHRSRDPQAATAKPE